MEIKNLNDVFNLSISHVTNGGLKSYIAYVFFYGAYLLASLLLLFFWGGILAKSLELLQSIL